MANAKRFGYHPAVKIHCLLSVLVTALAGLFYFPNVGMAQSLLDSAGDLRLADDALATKTDAFGAIIPTRDFGLAAAAMGFPPWMLTNGHMITPTRAAAGFAPTNHSTLTTSEHNSSFDADSEDGLNWDVASADTVVTASPPPESYLAGSNSTISDNANGSSQTLALAGELLNANPVDFQGDLSSSGRKKSLLGSFGSLAHAPIAITILFFAILGALGYVLWRRLLLLG